MTPRRVTQEDVARAAGVNRATVSLSLRNDRSIPVATREKIQRLAEEMCYVPDPLLSALARYRTNLRPATFQGVLAWVAQTTADYAWRSIAHFDAYLKAAEARSLRHGYRLEVLDVGELGISWKRAGKLAEARGIQGLLLCPFPNPDTDLRSFSWERFSAVTFGYTLTHPTLHSVAAAHHRAMLRCCQEMYDHGYRRFGFMCMRSHDQRVSHNLLSAYLAFGHQHPDVEPVDPYLIAEWNQASLPQWIEEQRLDGVITCDFEVHRRFPKWKRPKGLGVAVPMLVTVDTPLSGVWEPNAEIAEAAVDFLVSMVQRGEKGIPRNPQRLLVEGIWHEGTTLPRVRRGVAPHSTV